MSMLYTLNKSEFYSKFGTLPMRCQMYDRVLPSLLIIWGTT